MALCLVAYLIVERERLVKDSRSTSSRGVPVAVDPVWGSITPMGELAPSTLPHRPRSHSAPLAFLVLAQKSR